jgi:hypothetical protein
LITWRRLLLMIMTGWCLSATCSLLIQINFKFYLPCEWMRVSAVTCCDCKHAFEDFFFIFLNWLRQYFSNLIIIIKIKVGEMEKGLIILILKISQQFFTAVLWYCFFCSKKSNF